MDDPRQVYRVRMDAEIEQGKPDAWERYQAAAALALCPGEELELGRVKLPGLGVQEFRLQTMLGTINVEAHPSIADHDAYLIGSRVLVSPQRMSEMLRDAYLNPFGAAAALHAQIQPAIVRIASEGGRLG